jgi:CheY-like chemotaxis protein
MKILIVEDELDIIELISYHLKKEGFQVRFTSNGEDCLNFKTNTFPDLILLDLMLPGIDGLDVCKQLKSNPATHHIPRRCGQVPTAPQALP